MNTTPGLTVSLPSSLPLTDINCSHLLRGRVCLLIISLLHGSITLGTFTSTFSRQQFSPIPAHLTLQVLSVHTLKRCRFLWVFWRLCSPLNSATKLILFSYTEVGCFRTQFAGIKILPSNSAKANDSF